MSRSPNAPRDFDAPPTAMRNSAPGSQAIYAFGDAVALARRKDERNDLVFCDPAPLSDYWYRPLRDNMNGSPAPYVLAAATLTAQLADRGAVRARVVDQSQTGAFAAWRGKDDRVRLLFGNLEEGLRDDPDQSRRIAIALPAAWRDQRWSDAWGGVGAEAADRTLTVDLAPFASRLLIGNAARADRTRR